MYRNPTMYVNRALSQLHSTRRTTRSLRAKAKIAKPSWVPALPRLFARGADESSPSWRLFGAIVLLLLLGAAGVTAFTSPGTTSAGGGQRFPTATRPRSATSGSIPIAPATSDAIPGPKLHAHLATPTRKMSPHGMVIAGSALTAGASRARHATSGAGPITSRPSVHGIQYLPTVRTSPVPAPTQPEPTPSAPIPAPKLSAPTPSTPTATPKPAPPKPAPTPSAPKPAPLPLPVVSRWTAGVHAALHGHNHTPVAGRLWKYMVLATNPSGDALPGSATTEFMLHGNVVRRESPRARRLKKGRLTDRVIFPARFAGTRLVLRVVVRTPAGTVTLNWPVKARRQNPRPPSPQNSPPGAARPVI